MWSRILDSKLSKILAVMKHHKKMIMKKQFSGKGISLYNKSITRRLIIFKKPRKMRKDFLNNYMFVHTFQWTSSECLTNVTITVKVAMVTYIHSEKVN